MIISPRLVCYQCGGHFHWLAPDSRCSRCTRCTPEEIKGGNV